MSLLGSMTAGTFSSDLEPAGPAVSAASGGCPGYRQRRRAPPL